MFADAEYVIGYVAIALLVMLAITGTALAGSFGGYFNRGLVVCAWIPILFSLYMAGGAVYGIFTDDDFGNIGFLFLVAIPFFLAGKTSLSRLKRNKLSKPPPGKS